MAGKFHVFSGGVEQRCLTQKGLDKSVRGWSQMDVDRCQVVRENFESNVLTIERRREPMSSSVFGFFGLRDNPFSISPNPRFLYPTRLTQAASQQLVDAIRNRKGLILLTGEVGTGKTLLLHRVLDWLAQQKKPTAPISNSHPKPDHLLDFTLSDFRVPCESCLKSDKLISPTKRGLSFASLFAEYTSVPVRTPPDARKLAASSFVGLFRVSSESQMLCDKI